MNDKLPKIQKKKFEELLERYFQGTKKAIDQAQEELKCFLSQKKLRIIPTRFQQSGILQELLIWLSPYSIDDRIKKENKFFYLKDHFLIKDLVYERKGSCMSFTTLYVGLSRRMHIKTWAANVILSATNEDLNYDPTGHICVIDKKKRHWDCLYLEGNISSQHKKIQALTDEQLIASILTNYASILGEDRNQKTELFFLKEAIKLDFQNIHALLNLGAYYTQNNYLPKCALKIYRKVVEIDPNHARAWSRIGEQYEDLGKVNKAITSYERSISIKPTKEPLFRLIQIYSEKKDYENALISCAKFLEIEPNYVGIKEKCEFLKKKVIDLDSKNARFKETIQ